MLHFHEMSYSLHPRTISCWFCEFIEQLLPSLFSPYVDTVSCKCFPIHDSNEMIHGSPRWRREQNHPSEARKSVQTISLRILPPLTYRSLFLVQNIYSFIGKVCSDADILSRKTYGPETWADRVNPHLNWPHNFGP